MIPMPGIRQGQHDFVAPVRRKHSSAFTSSYAHHVDQLGIPAIMAHPYPYGPERSFSGRVSRLAPCLAKLPIPAGVGSRIRPAPRGSDFIFTRVVALTDGKCRTWQAIRRLGGAQANRVNHAP
jgi:hypothetical protein